MAGIILCYGRITAVLTDSVLDKQLFEQNKVIAFITQIQFIILACVTFIDFINCFIVTEHHFSDRLEIYLWNVKYIKLIFYISIK